MTLAPLLNDALRWAAAPAFLALGALTSLGIRLRALRFERAQRALARRYGIGPHTHVRGFDDETRCAIEAFAARHPDARFATTSGTSGAPKRVAYTRARLAAIKRENAGALGRMLLALGPVRPCLFILSSLKEEGSLASLLTSGAARPGYAEGLLVPSRYLAHPAVEALLERYGATAVRLWLLALSDPGIIYATNPSTLAVFLREVHDRWPAASALARAAVRDPASLAPEVHAVARRIAGVRARARLEAIAAAGSPPPLERWLPSLRAFCAWDGGYVRPFLEQVRRHVPEGRVAHVPMYAMSTETLMTLLAYEGRAPRFLPIAPGVLYEFLPEGAPDRPEALVTAQSLEPGRLYCMVVSDAFGLRRYCTDDLFRCRGRFLGLPDLAFERRRGLAFSFTGEKVTGEQVERALALVRERIPALAGVQLTLAPRFPEGAPLPCYRLLVAHAGETPPEGLDAESAAAAARALDGALSLGNSEYASKLASGRLAPAEAEVVSYDALAARLDPRARTEEARAGRAWESQWKLAPLLTRVIP